MNSWENFIGKLNALFGQSGMEDGLIRLAISAAIVVVGLAVLEVVFRYGRGRIQKVLDRKGYTAGDWKLSAFLPPLRLMAFALLLRLVEPLFDASQKFVQLLQGVAALFFILAAIIIIYVLIGWLDRMRSGLPASLQDRFPEKSLAKLKSFLRVSTIVVALAIFIYNLRAFFPVQLLQYPAWRYLLLIAILVLVYSAMRHIGGFLTNMAVVLKTSEENVRLRLVLEAAIWPIRLILITLAIYVVKEFLSFPPLAERIAGAAIDVFGTLAVVLFVYRLIELLVFELAKFAEREDNLLDNSFVQMMRMITRIVVIVIGAIYVARAVSGKPLSAMLAGLGIGGLALALAAQDTLKNFFGSVMIMLDKPFNVGQRILASLSSSCS